MEYRIEHDSMGEIRVPCDKYWAAQTQRSHENFPIGVGAETMPLEIIRAFGVDHVLFGSDYPMWNPGEEKRRLEALALTAAEKQAIFYDNAARLLNL